METLLKLRLLLIFNHIAIIVGIYFSSLYWLLLSFVGYLVIGRFGAEIGLHRYFSHKSFKTQPWKEKLMVAASVFVCVGSPLWWVGTHRKHHDISDTIQDPLAPQNRLRVWNIKKWKEKLKNINIEKKYSQDIFRNANIKFVHKHYFKILIGSYVFLGIIDWHIPVFLISAGSVIEFYLVGITNGLGHEGNKMGYRNFNTNDNSTNITWLNYLTLGSGLHNNHHHMPFSSNLVAKQGEIDLLSKFIDKFLKIK